jgi:hypothetical protein
MKPVTRGLRRQSNDHAEVGFPSFFSYLGRWRRYNAPFEESVLSVRGDAQFATGAANDGESLFFPVICACRGVLSFGVSGCAGRSASRPIGKPPEEILT